MDRRQMCWWFQERSLAQHDPTLDAGRSLSLSVRKMVDVPDRSYQPLFWSLSGVNAKHMLSVCRGADSPL